jgi:DNA primase
MLDKGETIKYIVEKIKKDAEINYSAIYDILLKFSLKSFIEDITGQSFRIIGNKYRTNCPFKDHEDINASFFVYDNGVDKPETFYCFGCSTSTGGNAVNFIQSFYNMSKREAIEFLKSIYVKYVH